MNNFIRSSVLATSLMFLIAISSFGKADWVKLDKTSIIACFADPLEPDTETDIQFFSDFEALEEDIETSFYWEFGDGSTSDEVEPVHTFMEAGSYAVSLTVQHGDTIDGCSLSISVSESTPLPCDSFYALHATYFDWNSSEITDDAMNDLEDNLSSMLGCPNVQITIEGYVAFNESRARLLSQERADAIGEFYVDGGLDIERITDTTGKGIFEMDEGKSGSAQKVETIVWLDTINQ